MSFFFKCRPNEMCLSTEKNKNKYQISIQNIQFNPPRPSYMIKFQSEGLKKDNSQFQKVQFIHDRFNEDNISPCMKVSCYSLAKGKKDQIIALYIQNRVNEAKGDNQLTIIYSHDESNDLGTICSRLIDLSMQLKVNILSYDYTGYGRSTGKAPSKDSLMKDIELVLNLALKELNIKKEQLILYGVEIGMVPSVLICCKVAYKYVYGMVLVSLILINEFVNGMFNCISCPVYIIHGKRNLNYEGIKSACKQFKNKNSWHPNLMSTEEIITKKRAKFYIKMKGFIKQVNSMLSSANFNESLCSEFRTSTHLPYEYEIDNHLHNKERIGNLISSSSRQTGLTEIQNTQQNIPDSNENDSDLSYEGSL